MSSTEKQSMPECVAIIIDRYASEQESTEYRHAAVIASVIAASNADEPRRWPEYLQDEVTARGGQLDVSNMSAAQLRGISRVAFASVEPANA